MERKRRRKLNGKWKVRNYYNCSVDCIDCLAIKKEKSISIGNRRIGREVDRRRRKGGGGREG
jgi:hypothetical protein